MKEMYEAAYETWHGPNVQPIFISTAVVFFLLPSSNSDALRVTSHHFKPRMNRIWPDRKYT